MLRGRFEIAAGSRGMSRPWRRSKIVRVVRFVIKALDYLRELNILSLALRLLLAMLLGGAIGFERGRKGRAAGFRTYMLVCLGATLTGILSQYLFVMVSTSWADVAAEVGRKVDVSRFGAKAIGGVGFLGAGHHPHHRAAKGTGAYHGCRPLGFSLYGTGDWCRIL